MKLRKLITMLMLVCTSCSALAITVKTYKWRTDSLNRGVVAIPQNKGNFISWRFLPSDNPSTSFEILRNGTSIAKNITNSTCFDDTKGTATSKYQIVIKQNGEPIDTTEKVSPWKTKYYLELKIDVPPSGSFHGSAYNFSAGDCSLGDVDGDGEYEIIVKFDPDNQQDSAYGGYTGPCIIDCYKLNGKKLWRINLGPNIRTGAHYTQFLVYDFDGDGKAEMICKTAPGSIDGKGNYVSAASDVAAIKTTNNKTDYTNSDGREGGPEFLTVFNGETGAAIHTVYYNPNRAGSVGGSPAFPTSDYWGKANDGGNRASRHLACVAFLNGANSNPSAVMVRGYYARSFIWAVDFDGKKLKTRWLHHSMSTSQYSVQLGTGTAKTYSGKTPTSSDGWSHTAYYGGNHNLSVADVDFDGKDEILLGAACLDNNGQLLYTTGLGHGDAMHVSDMDPDRPGLEVFTVQEASPFGMTYYAAEDGKILFRKTGSKDTGRGIAADVWEKRGFEFWSAADGSAYNVDGKVVGNRGSQNFRVYWDGDLLDELLDGGTITKANGVELKINGKSGYSYGSSCNGTKATPNLSADLFGDWREEIILHTNTSLIILSTTEPTEYRVPCLMTDHTYRLAIAWQNCCYNQPPHLGYYLPDNIALPKYGFTLFDESLRRQSVVLGDSIKPVKIHWDGCTNVSTYKTYLPDGKSKSLTLPEGWKITKDTENANCVITGLPDTLGTYTFILRSIGQIQPEQFYDTIYVDVISEAQAISEIFVDEKKETQKSVYDISGRYISKEVEEGLKPGIYIIEGKKRLIK